MRPNDLILAQGCYSSSARLKDLLGCDVEDDVLAIVLSGHCDETVAKMGHPASGWR
jgi:hypothetical protein